MALKTDVRHVCPNRPSAKSFSYFDTKSAYDPVDSAGKDGASINWSTSRGQPEYDISIRPSGHPSHEISLIDASSNDNIRCPLPQEANLQANIFEAFIEKTNAQSLKAGALDSAYGDTDPFAFQANEVVADEPPRWREDINLPGEPESNQLQHSKWSRKMGLLARLGRVNFGPTFVSEVKRTLLAFLFLFTVAYTMTIVQQLSDRRWMEAYTKQPGLHHSLADLGFDMFASVPVKHSKLFLILADQSVNIMLFATLVILLISQPNWTARNVFIRRAFWCVGALYCVRTITILVTTVPSPRPECVISVTEQVAGIMAVGAAILLVMSRHAQTTCTRATQCCS